MRVTIINPDSSVYVNGFSFGELNLKQCNIPSNVHAMQWYDTFGSIELISVFNNGTIEKPANETITDLPEWALKAIAVWETAKLDFDKAQELANQPLTPVTNNEPPQT